MDEFEKNYNRALRFLSFRPRSEKELKDYFKKKKTPENIVDQIILKLKEQRFLNDDEFVRWWISQRTSIKPRALRVIKNELSLKGISKEKTDEILEKNYKDKDDFSLAFYLAKKRLDKYKNLKKEEFFQKMGRYLASRGFNYCVISKVIKELESQVDGQS